MIYGNGNMIFQAPGYVTITYEMVHDTRIIPLDGRPHVGKNIRTYMGDARGRWEGSTLVVETTNFKDQIAYRGAVAAKSVAQSLETFGQGATSPPPSAGSSRTSTSSAATRRWSGRHRPRTARPIRRPR